MSQTLTSNLPRQLIDSNLENRLVYWRKRNAYYYRWIDTIYRFCIGPGSRVLHVGCECGDLLAAVEPSFGVGIDPDADAISLAEKRFPDLHFYCQDVHCFSLEECFDYVIISNSLGQWRDVQRVLENIRHITNNDTRIIITYYNYLWEGILRFGSMLRICRPRSYQNWLSTEDIVGLLRLADFEVIRKASYMMMPKRIPLVSDLFNRFLSVLPGFRCLNLITLLVARACPSQKYEENVSVSVIVPCRNEKGNIGEVVHRIPPMGREMEIIFVDGNSSDGTVAEIGRQIELCPDREIRLIHQGNGTGKGDAVRKGFAAATGDVFVIQDADLTTPPEDLPKFLRAWCTGKGEFINGSRMVYPLEKQAMRYLNILGNKFFCVLFSWLLGQRFRDTLCGTKMFSRQHYELIAAHRDFFGEFDPFGDFDLILGAVKQNLKVAEIPVRYSKRTYGETNISRFRHGWLLLKMSWLSFKKIKWLKCGS